MTSNIFLISLISLYGFYIELFSFSALYIYYSMIRLFIHYELLLLQYVLQLLLLNISISAFFFFLCLLLSSTKNEHIFGFNQTDSLIATPLVLSFINLFELS